MYPCIVVLDDTQTQGKVTARVKLILTDTVNGVIISQCHLFYFQPLLIMNFLNVADCDRYPKNPNEVITVILCSRFVSDA